MGGRHWGLQDLKYKRVDALLSICILIGYPDGCNLRVSTTNDHAAAARLALAADR